MTKDSRRQPGTNSFFVGTISITMDNGPEFTGIHLDEWAFRKGVKLNFIRPGKPIENAFAESFNGRLRDELTLPRKVGPVEVRDFL